MVDENEITPEILARAAAYYYVHSGYKDEEKWSNSISSPRTLNQAVGYTLDYIGEKGINVVCNTAEVLNILVNNSEMFSEDSKAFLRDLQSKADEEAILLIASKIKEIQKGGYTLSNSNKRKLNRLISKAGGIKPSMCSKTATKKQNKERDSKTQPMSLSNLLSMLQQSEAKEFADKIFQAMKKDMPDLRISEAKKEKTPLLSNTIEILKSIEDKEIQQVAWKSILQIGDKTKSQLTKSGILTRAAKDDIEDSETEEVSMEDLVTPSSKQNFQIFARRLQQIPFPFVREYVVDIIQSVSKDVPERLLGTLKGDKIEEQEPRRFMINIPNVISLLKKIREEKSKLTAGQVYVLIQRFLKRNGLQIKDSDKKIIDRLGITLGREDTIEFLQKVHSKNLEEQKYNMLLKRLKIK